MKEYVHNSELNLELQLMTDVIKLESLHYGYWDEPRHENLSLDDIKAAQHQYTVSLEKLIPDDVSSILDVGCGIGDNAKYLVEMGYKVLSISPDANHGQFFDPILENSRFIQSTIEALDIPGEIFDMVLMSESQNYFEIEDGLTQVRRYLKPGGYLLISGNFSKTTDDVYETIHKEEDYNNKALKYGLSLIKRIDITENVLPTLTFTRELFNGHLVPALTIMGGYLERQMPVRSKLAKLFLGGQFKRIESILDYYGDFLDHVNYTSHVNYVRNLYQMKLATNGH